MKHPHAEILQAIAEDKDTEIECANADTVTDAHPYYKGSLASLVAHPEWLWRIKPKPFVINGVECPRTVETGLPYLTITGVGIKDGPYKRYHFATDADLMLVFNAVIKPFEDGK